MGFLQEFSPQVSQKARAKPAERERRSHDHRVSYLVGHRNRTLCGRGSVALGDLFTNLGQLVGEGVQALTREQPSECAPAEAGTKVLDDPLRHVAVREHREDLPA